MNSGIEVFFTKVNKPFCNGPEANAKYFVNVFDCCGVYKLGVPAPNGYVSIDLPPGNYLIVGTWKGIIYPNYDSNETMVTVCCSERPCVKIIPRSLHQCTWWLTAALKLIAAKPDEAPAVAAFAPDAVKILEKIAAAIPQEYHFPTAWQQALDPIIKEGRG